MREGNVTVHSDLSIQENSHSFEERSEIAQEIIDSRPDIVEKWTVPIFFGMAILFVLCAWFIKYPDIVVGNAVLISENSPKEIMIRKSGRLISLHKTDNQKVNKGEIIGWIESAASPTHVLDLAKRLENGAHFLMQRNHPAIYELFNKKYDSLGELQIPYQIFSAKWQEFNDYLINGYYQKQIAKLRSDIASLNSVIEKTNFKKSILIQDYNLAERSYQMNDTLYKQRANSVEELRRAHSMVLSKQLQLSQVDIDSTELQRQIREKQEDIDKIDHSIILQQQIFEQALYTLKSSVDDWLQKYVLIAPIEGVLVFTLPLQVNQYLQEGKLIGYTNPKVGRYYAEVVLEQKNFGKVDTGMIAQLRFPAFPYQEVGFVEGKLEYLSAIATDTNILGKIRLDRGLVTNQRKVLQYRSGLKAEAYIITKNVSLLERIYRGVVKSL